jgi:hypothetical protein
MCENMSFPCYKCIPCSFCINWMEFLHHNWPGTVWTALLSNVLSKMLGNKKTPRILPAPAERPESIFVLASFSASYHLYWPTQATKMDMYLGKCIIPSAYRDSIL